MAIDAARLKQRLPSTQRHRTYCAGVIANRQSYSARPIWIARQLEERFIGAGIGESCAALFQFSVKHSIALVKADETATECRHHQRSRNDDGRHEGDEPALHIFYVSILHIG